jgi:hypothetical protein
MDRTKLHSSLLLVDNLSFCPRLKSNYIFMSQTVVLPTPPAPTMVTNLTAINYVATMTTPSVRPTMRARRFGTFEDLEGLEH